MFTGIIARYNKVYAGIRAKLQEKKKAVCVRLVQVYKSRAFMATLSIMAYCTMIFGKMTAAVLNLLSRAAYCMARLIEDQERKEGKQLPVPYTAAGIKEAVAQAWAFRAEIMQEQKGAWLYE